MDIATSADALLGRIADAARRAARSPADVTLVAASKKQSIEKMRDYLAFSQSRGMEAVFGENYVQEFKAKRPQLGSGFTAHLIGPLQRNKAKDAVALFDVIETVHSRELIDALAKCAGQAQKTQRIFLQVNISADPAKSGFSPDEVPSALAYVREIPELRVEGLMAITKLYDTAEGARDDFRRMTTLRDSLPEAIRPMGLSMGMSDDFEVAVEEGATVVRIGSALFGKRA